MALHKQDLDPFVLATPPTSDSLGVSSKSSFAAPLTIAASHRVACPMVRSSSLKPMTTSSSSRNTKTTGGRASSAFNELIGKLPNLKKLR